MTTRIETAIAAFFLAVGVAGPPLEPLRILGALILCAGVVPLARFTAAAALLAVVFGGWLQHGQFRIAQLAGAALLGIAVRFWGTTPRAATVIMGLAAVTGTAWLFLG